VPGEIGLEPFCEFTPRKHNTPPANFAFESNIRAETGDGPFVGAARMLFAEAQVIVEVQVGEHSWNAEGRMMNDECVNIIPSAVANYAFSKARKVQLAT
jgi:hypothetical protein